MCTGVALVLFLVALDLSFIGNHPAPQGLCKFPLVAVELGLGKEVLQCGKVHLDEEILGLSSCEISFFFFNLFCNRVTHLQKARLPDKDIGFRSELSPGKLPDVIIHCLQI